jgi:hypothetical protein
MATVPRVLVQSSAPPPSLPPSVAAPLLELLVPEPPVPPLVELLVAPLLELVELLVAPLLELDELDELLVPAPPVAPLLELLVPAPPAAPLLELLVAEPPVAVEECALLPPPHADATTASPSVAPTTTMRPATLRIELTSV